MDDQKIAFAESTNRGFFLAGVRLREDAENINRGEFKNEVVQLHDALAAKRSFYLKYYSVSVSCCIFVRFLK